MRRTLATKRKGRCFLLPQGPDPFLSAINRRDWRIIQILLLAAAPAPYAMAQTQGPLLDVEIPFHVDRGRNISVTQRPKPELDAQGLPLGAFRLYPSITTGIDYSSNVYGLTENGRGDAALMVSPRLELRTNWSRHYARFVASGNIQRQFRESIRNRDGYLASAEGRLDIVGESNLYGQASIEHTYEEQYSGAFPANSAAPVPLTRAIGIIRGTYDLNRLRLVLNGDITDLNYSDSRSLSGTIIDGNYRDRTIMRSSFRGEYALTPDTAVFMQATYADSSYKNTLEDQPQRDSHEIRILAGVTFDLSNLVRASIGVGSVHRKYASSYYGSLNNIAADIRIEYFLSSLTTLSFLGRRSIEDAISGNSPGFLATSGAVRADHELLRNLVLNLGGSYEEDDFATITRRDRQLRLSGGAHYTPFRNVIIEPQVNYTDRKSRGDFQGQSFKEIRMMVKATYRL